MAKAKARSPVAKRRADVRCMMISPCTPTIGHRRFPTVVAEIPLTDRTRRAHLGAFFQVMSSENRTVIFPCTNRGSSSCAHRARSPKYARGEFGVAIAKQWAKHSVMNVSLTPELENFVADKVKSGRYTSASEVVREALRLLEEREQLRDIQKQELRKNCRRPRSAWPG